MKIKQVFKKRFVRIFSVLAAVGVLGSFGFSAFMSTINGNAANMTFSTGIGHGFAGYEIPYITGANGTVAYCLNHNLAFPTGQAFNGVDATAAYNSPQVKGILYYGYAGAGQNELMAKYGLSAHDARLATQLTIWKYGRRTGDIPGNQDISPDINTGNAQIDRYMNELIGRTYSGNGAPAISIAQNVPTRHDGEFQISDPVVVTTSGSWSVQFSDTRVAQVDATPNSFRMRAPKDFRGSVTATVTGAAGRNFTPTVWSSGNGGIQSLISNGGMTDAGRNTASTVINFDGEEDFNAEYKIKKTDPQGVVKSGAVFEVSQSRNFDQILATITSGADGYTPTQTFTIPGAQVVPTTVLYVREKTAPAGMVRSTEIKEIVIMRGDNTVKEVTFVNTYDTADADVKIFKKDANGRSVDGAVFDVSDDRSFPAGRTQRVTTIAHPLYGGGSAVAGFAGYARGARVNLYIKEISAPAGLVVDPTIRSVTVTAGGEAGSIEIVNQFETNEARAKIVKKDAAGNLVQGVQFEIATNAQFTGAETLTTNAQGEISKSFTATGTQTLPTVYVREKTVPAHLVLDTRVQSKQLVDGQTATFEFTNQFKPVTLKLVKKDAAGNFVQGVVFEVSESQNFANPTTLTTGANGEISREFPTTTREKTFYVREKTVPAHLVLSTEVKNVRISAGQTGTVEYVNQFKGSQARIIKKDAANKLVQGVQFEIATNAQFAGAETLTTNAQGEISKSFQITTATPPTVYVREKSAPAYLVVDTRVQSKPLVIDGTVTFEFTNQFNQADLTIRKVDEKGKTVQGVVFEIADNAQFTNPQTVTTNAQGVATRRYPTTQAAKTYYIREKSVPSHLVLSKEVKTLTLAPNTNPTVTFTNEFVEREVKLSKRDVSSADPIEGVTFTIYDAEDKDNKTKIYETITNKEGDLPGLKLKPGKYKFIETHAPIGYKINPNPHFFEVLEDGTILGSTIMTDEREEYEFEIDKVDNKGNKVRGVVFEAKNKLTGEILTATTDQDGVAKFKGIWADYEITEKSAPEGYEKDNNVYVLQLKIDGTYERMKVVNNKIEAPNTGAESANFLPILAGVASILLGGTAFFAKKRF